jgi:hypothetical protein
VVVNFQNNECVEGVEASIAYSLRESSYTLTFPLNGTVQHVDTAKIKFTRV